MSPDLVQKWIEHHSASSKEYIWAWQELTDLVDLEPELAWNVVLEIFQSTSDELVLSNLAAGPLEDILCEYGASFIDRFEIYARQNPGFAQMAKGVWISDPKEIADRVHMVQGKYS